MGKTSFIAISFIFIITLLFSDTSITRGPDIGEIYYIGPTVTQNEAIYYSTDFGETATCMDTISEMGKICADLTTGSLYRTRMPNVMYYSNNYGQYGSWIFRSNDISIMHSGRTEGHIYNGKAQHSENYGVNFVTHQCQGFFGNLNASEIDNEDDVGYALVRESDVLDSLWLLISYDDFENLEIQYIFNGYIGDNTLTRGYENGELYLYRRHSNHGKNLLYSNNYGQTWELKNTFNNPNLPIMNIVGGRQPGELFMNVEYIQLLSTIKHTYIYHSLDYGETFTIYHPFNYGDEPYYANYIATPDSGNAPLTVQFTDISSGVGGLTWEWDFDDDGIVDSYEQNPEYTYQDSGLYQVTLQILNGMYDPELIASQYIHVSGITGIEHEEIIDYGSSILQNYPNPFNPSTIIRYQLPYNIDNPNIEIYNLKGQLVDEIAISSNQSSVTWHADDFASGIYFYKLNIKNSPTQKMLLFK